MYVCVCIYTYIYIYREREVHIFGSAPAIQTTPAGRAPPILYYIILYYSILYYIMLYYIILYCIIRCNLMLYYSTL